MARKIFEEELERIQEDLLSLGLMVEDALVESVDALKQRDLEKSQQIIDADKAINKKRFDIEHEALVTMATQQPMAGDLRLLAAILEIATELERMGDYAKGIAKISIKIGAEPILKPLIDIPRMAEKARGMLHRALRAFIDRDVNLAKAIPAEDNEMDSIYDQIFRELMTYILADPRVIERASYLIWVAHNLERAADRVINICERVIFTVTGEMMEMTGHEKDYPPSTV
ncbi:MAG: phosphate signaling complex protein PhoU [Syntrophobacteraceae bacterium]